MPPLTKELVIASAANSTLGDWMHVEVTDPTIMALVDTDGGLYVRTAAGVRVPAKVIARSGMKATIAMMMQPASTTPQTLTVYAWPGRPARAYRAWRVTPMAPPVAKLDLTFTTGQAIATTTQSVHPNVIAVPPDSWLAWSGGLGTVTHVMVDTPLPGGDASYENPSLMYSRDNGATWAEWPGVTNPIDLPAENCHLSDCCLAIRSDGSLMVMYRQRNTSTQALTMLYRIVTGTSLSDATVGEQQVADFSAPSAVTVAHSPTIWRESDNLWYCFGGEGTFSPTGPYSYYRWTSTDEGETWTDRISVLTMVGSQTAVAQGYWHGGQVVKVGNWYYLAVAEDILSTGLGTSGNFRVFRSLDLTTWEPSSSLLLIGLPTWASGPGYCPCLFLGTDGGVRCIFSSYSGSNPYIGLLDLGTLSEDGALSTAGEVIGRGRDSGRAIAPLTDLGVWDLAEGPSSGLMDLSSGAHNLAVLSGAPAYTAGVGYTLNGATPDGLSAGIKLAGLTSFEIELDLTTGAYVGGAREVIMADSEAVGGTASRAFYLAYRNTGNIFLGIRGTGALIETQTTTGTAIAPNARYHMRLQYTAARGLRLFVDGVAIAELPIAHQLGIYDSGGSLTFGRYVFASANGYPANITFHRIVIKSGCTAQLLERAPTSRWTAGTAAIGGNLARHRHYARSR